MVATPVAAGVSQVMASPVSSLLTELAITVPEKIVPAARAIGGRPMGTGGFTGDGWRNGSLVGKTLRGEAGARI